jgi:amino acid transporter
MENNNDLLSTELIIDAATGGNLKEVAMWSRFLGILGFIYSIVISILAILSGFFFEKAVSRYEANGMAMIGSIFIGIIYFIMAVVIFFLSLYLFRFGNKVQLALKTNDQETLSESFKNLKLYFRFIGIFTLISLIFTVLAVIGILVSAAFR